MNGSPTCVGNYQPIKTSSTHVIYLRDTTQNGGREPTLFKFIKAAHNCRAVWDVSSLAYKDTNKNKQNKTEERADKLGFVQTFYFSAAFCFFSSFLCFTVVRECYYTCHTVFVIWHEFDVWRKEFLKFSNTSLPTYVCRIKLCLLLWLGFFKTMKLLLSVRRDLSLRCREIILVLNRVQSTDFRRWHFCS